MGVLYLLMRYNHAKEFYYSYRTNILLVLKSNFIANNDIETRLTQDAWNIVKANSTNKDSDLIKLVSIYSRYTLTEILFSTKPLKLRYWFTREEILLLNRKVK